MSAGRQTATRPRLRPVAGSRTSAVSAAVAHWPSNRAPVRCTVSIRGVLSDIEASPVAFGLEAVF
jgi:hypothetical protein